MTVRLIEDQDELFTRLTELQDKAGPGNVRLCGRTPDGHALLRKTTGLPATVSKTPKVPAPGRIKTLIEKLGIKFLDEYVERVVPYWASDERVDGDGDIVRQNWSFDEYAKNSPLMYSHDWFSPPIGRAIDWKVVGRKDDDYRGKALWLLTIFATAEQNPFADSVFRLVNSGLLVSGSVGFYATAASDPDDEERERLGLGRYGLVFEENHLLEYSTTPIPANSGAHVATALAEACEKGLRTQDVLVLREAWRSNFPRGENDAEQWLALESGVVALAKVLWPGEEFEIHRELDVPLLATQSLPQPETTPDAAVLDQIAALRTAFDDHVEATEVIMNDVRSAVERIERSPRGDRDEGEPEPVSEELRKAVGDLSKLLGN